VAQWELSKVKTVLEWITGQEGHVTRMDCALDDRETIVPLSTIREAVQAGQCVTRAERLRTIASESIHHGTNHGATLYFGSPQSHTMLRIYEKALELQSKGREDWQQYGVRWELEFKKERAQTCAKALLLLDESDWREYVVGLLRGYVDFRDTSRQDEEEDRYRAPLLPWWEALTEGFKKGRLNVEKTEPSLPKLKRWITHAVAPSLAVVCAADDEGQVWLERQIVESVRRWKSRHLVIVKNRRKKHQPEPRAGGHAGATFD
jgi:hypothetical protein